MQRIFNTCLFLKAWVVCAMLAVAPLTFAALGGDTTSISRDQSHMRAQLRASASNGYSVHELQTEAGVNVREYIAAGKVFAVAWDGPSLPDLSQLLGTHFPAFKQSMAARRSRGVRGPVALQQNDLVVESRGNMRAFTGRAYVPSLLPPQVSIDEIH